MPHAAFNALLTGLIFGSNAPNRARPSTVWTGTGSARRKRHNPPGTKLLKKARTGKLTINSRGY